MGLGRTVVTADLWDVAMLDACEDCRGARVDRLQRLNTSGRAEAGVECGRCSGIPRSLDA
jgi:archaeosine synthase beta-subunit